MKRLLPVFVYGTLRQGLALHRLLSPAIVEKVSVGECHVAGYLYLHHRADYPVLKTPGVNGWAAAIGRVKGDLYILDADDWHTVDVTMMELGAGYNAEWLPVFDSNTGEKLDDALAFTWNWPDVGAHIVSGDYSKEEAAWQ